MIIYCSGDDSYRRLAKVSELVASYRAKNPESDLFVVDFDDEPERVPDTLDFLKQPTLFSGKKLAVVRGGARIADKAWVSGLKKFLDDEGVFVLISDSGKPVRQLSFLAKPPVRRFEFEELQGAELSAFIRSYADSCGAKLAPGALEFLRAYAETQKERSLCVKQELDKASMLPHPVRADTFAELTRWRKEDAFFDETLTFLKERTLERRLVALERLFGRREDNEYVFNMVASLVRGEAAKQLAAYDVCRKSGKLEVEESLLGFALHV